LHQNTRDLWLIVTSAAKQIKGGITIMLKRSALITILLIFFSVESQKQTCGVRRRGRQEGACRMPFKHLRGEEVELADSDLD
jgi:hypothetical protein